MENPVILRVNDNEITNNEVVIYLKATGQFSAALQEMIKIKALENYADEKSLKATDEELQDFVNNKRKQMKLFSGDDIQKYLQTLGITSDQWIDTLEIEFTRQKIKDHVINDEKITQYFEENQLQFVTVELFQIIVDSKGAAEEVLMEVRDDKEDFSKVAMEVCIDNKLKASGGYIGEIARGSLPVEVESKVFTSSVGDIIGPFSDGDFYSVYKIGKINKPELDDKMKPGLKDKLFEMWLSQLIQSQKIQAG